MDETLFLQVRDFVSEQRGVRPDKISLSSELYRDLGLYGDDVDEFFIAYQRRFDVDISNLILSQHFPGERAFEMIRILLRRCETEFIPITVRTLVEAAAVHKWPSLG